MERGIQGETSQAVCLQSLPPFFFFVLSVAKKRFTRHLTLSCIATRRKLERTGESTSPRKKKQFHILSTQPAEIRKKNKSSYAGLNNQGSTLKWTGTFLPERYSSGESTPLSLSHHHADIIFMDHGIQHSYRPATLILTSLPTAIHSLL